MHISFITSPVPWQLLHGLVVCICPSIVVCTCRIWPVPPHTEHFSGLVPGLAPVPLQVLQFSFRDIFITFSVPKNASSKVMSKLYLKSAPFLGPEFEPLLPLEPKPPPKKDEKMSPKSPKSPNPSNPDELYE